VRSAVGMFPNVISVEADDCQYHLYTPRYLINLPAVLETLAFTELAVAIRVALSKLRLVERKKLLSNTGSQSPNCCPLESRYLTVRAK
jgi:hypothetical protein